MTLAVGLVARTGRGRALRIADRLRERLEAAGVEVWLAAETAARLDRPGRSLDRFDEPALVVAIGGDGTFLTAARAAGGTPVLGIDLGEVGFLNAVGPDAAVPAVLAAVAAVRAGELEVREVPRLAARGDGWAVEPAINEVAIQGARRGHGGGVHAEVRIDGSRYVAGRADGVLVATPTGSTAYSLSERGPLVHPSVAGLVVTPMAPRAGTPPLVVDTASTVRVRLTDAPSVAVVGDGHGVERLAPPAEVTVTTTGPPVRIAGPGTDFFAALAKLD